MPWPATGPLPVAGRPDGPRQPRSACVAGLFPRAPGIGFVVVARPACAQLLMAAPPRTAIVCGVDSRSPTSGMRRVRRRTDQPAVGSPSIESQARRRWLALAVLCLPLLIVSLDNTVLNVVLPTLERRLHASTSQLQWIVDAYVLVFAGLLLVCGSLADRIGRKRTFIAGLVAFAAGSTWASTSGSVAMLIAARASMGIGAALIMPSTLSIITNTFRDGGERQRALGVWSGTSGAGIALGPIVGGLLLAHFWWGSVFLINVPIALIGLACAIPLVPDSKNEHALPPDAVGSVLSIVALALVVWAIIEAPVRGWSSVLVISAGAAGLAVLAAFAVWEWHSTHPMLQLRFFRRRSFSAAVSSVGLVTFGLFGALFVLTQFLQLQLGYTPLQAGLRSLPAAGAIAIVAPLCDTVLVRRLGIKLTVVAGMLLIATGLYGISAATVTTTYSGTVLGLTLLGVGAGLVIPARDGLGHGLGAARAHGCGVGDQRHIPPGGRRVRRRGDREPHVDSLPAPPHRRAVQSSPSGRVCAHRIGLARRRAGPRPAPRRGLRSGGGPQRARRVRQRNGPGTAGSGGRRPGRCPPGTARPAVESGGRGTRARAHADSDSDADADADADAVIACARATRALGGEAHPPLRRDGAAVRCGHRFLGRGCRRPSPGRP